MININNRNSKSNNDNGAHANDNKHQEEALGAVPSVPTGGALTSAAALEALGTALNKVNTMAYTGRTGKLLMQYKSRENLWVYGPKGTTPEEHSQWGLNPLSYKYGYVCFSAANKVIGEIMVSVSQPMPAVEDLPDLGSPWQPQWSVELKCTTDADAGTEVVYKTTTDGGKQAILGSIETVRDRLNGGQHGGRVAPIICLERESYPHAQYGRVWKPILAIVDWMPIDGPAPAPESASPPPPVPPVSSTSAAEQPRRRRV